MASCDGFHATFNFNWKIKNFSHCLPGACVKSPTFTADSMDKTKWCLQLRPKKHQNGSHIEFYLVREPDKNDPGTMRVVFELSFLDTYGIQLVKKTKEASFKKGESKGFAEFLEQAVIFNHRKFEYLPEDTLTACCRMKQIGELIQKPVVFCSANTLIGFEQCLFNWEIRDFSKLRPGMLRITRKRDPPYFRVELSLTPKPNEELQLEISHAHVHKPNMTDCEIRVKSVFEDTAYSKRDSKYLKGEVWKFPIFVKKEQLTAEKNVYLQNDTLVLKFDVTVSLGVLASVLEGYRSASLEDETSSSSENEDFSTAKHTSEMKQKINTLKKLKKETEKDKDMIIKKIENIEKAIAETKVNEDIKTKELETLKKALKEAKNLEKRKVNTIKDPQKVIKESENVKEIKTKELESLKESLKEAEKVERITFKAIESLKKALKEVETVKEKMSKENPKEISHDSFSTSVTESSLPVQTEEFYSTGFDSFGKSGNNLSRLRKEDRPSTDNEEIMEIKKDIDTLKKAIKEIGKS